MKHYWVYRYWYTFLSNGKWTTPRSVESLDFSGQHNHVSDERLSPEQAIEEGKLQLSYFRGFNYLVRWEEEERIVTTNEVALPEKP